MIKYNIISPRTGKQEPWSGLFYDDDKASEWYNTHGRQWEKEGKVLVKVKASQQEINYFTESQKQENGLQGIDTEK